ncbi:MAG: family transcriptional regulator [Aeromicrobium sp.]|jgi:predicted NBD/HSP70 family sugar kinase|nr:family transcriptional regulator [Aeromicrobium sp.]
MVEAKESARTVHSPTERAVLSQLLRSRPTTRTRLVADTGISAASVSRAVEHLIGTGVVREGDEVVAGTRGRRAVTLDLDGSRGIVVGIDLGASNIRIIVADLVATPLASAELPTPSDLAATELAQALVDTARELCGERWGLLRAVSVGLPGAVRADGPSVSNANNLQQVEDPRLLKTLRAGFGEHVQLVNDADLALLGEQRFGAAVGAPTAAILTFGTGLGAGMARDGVLVQGRHGIVGEFGQLPVGPLGTRLEHMVTGPGILRRAAESGIAMNSPADLFVSDPAPALAAMRTQFDTALIIALTAITVACEPDVLVLGGGLAPSLEPDLARYREAVELHVHYAPRLVLARLGTHSGAAGAVVAALTDCYRRLGVADEALGDAPVGALLDLDRVRAVARPPGAHD